MIFWCFLKFPIFAKKINRCKFSELYFLSHVNVSFLFPLLYRTMSVCMCQCRIFPRTSTCQNISALSLREHLTCCEKWVWNQFGRGLALHSLAICRRFGALYDNHFATQFIRRARPPGLCWWLCTGNHIVNFQTTYKLACALRSASFDTPCSKEAHTIIWAVCWNIFSKNSWVRVRDAWLLWRPHTQMTAGSFAWLLTSSAPDNKESSRPDARTLG